MDTLKAALVITPRETPVGTWSYSSKKFCKPVQAEQAQQEESSTEVKHDVPDGNYITLISPPLFYM